MKKFKRVLAIVMALCMMLVAMSASAADDHIDAGDMTEIENRRPVLVLTPGSGSGQVGYGGSEISGYIGPNAFAMVGDDIYILDTENQRIVKWNGSEYTNISISSSPNANRMKIENQKIGVVDNDAGVTAVYTLDGALVTNIEHPSVITDERVSGLKEIGESYLIWETYNGKYYRYEWTQDLLTETEYGITLIKDDSGTTSTCNANANETWVVNSENKDIAILGIADENLVYQQYEYVPDASIFLMELSVRKSGPQGKESYAIIDFSNWYAHPLEPFYMTDDGKVYIMECFEDYTVISEVVLGNVDISRMPELKAIAETRKMTSPDANIDMIGGSLLRIDRNAVLSRAKAMANLQWKVLAGHKVKPAGHESVVTIPSSVLNTADNTYYTGIPYCWGGNNGLDTLTMGESFSSQALSGEYTAGNISSANGSEKVPNTIGLDCSGFVSSAYKLDGAKKGTYYFSIFGSAVTIDDMRKMDFLVKYEGLNGNNHVVLFYSESPTTIVTYESFVDNGTGDGKVTMRDWAKTKLSAYVPRTPFCGTCNYSSVSSISPAGHFLVCSTCAGLSELLDHTFANNTCTVCGYRQ